MKGGGWGERGARGTRGPSGSSCSRPAQSWFTSWRGGGTRVGMDVCKAPWPGAGTASLPPPASGRLVQSKSPAGPDSKRVGQTPPASGRCDTVMVPRVRLEGVLGPLRQPLPGGGARAPPGASTPPGASVCGRTSSIACAPGPTAVGNPSLARSPCSCILSHSSPGHLGWTNQPPWGQGKTHRAPGGPCRPRTANSREPEALSAGLLFFHPPSHQSFLEIASRAPGPSTELVSGLA